MSPRRAVRTASASPVKTAAGPTPASLSALCGIGVLSALWALFLWGELLRARAGSSPFCPFGDDAACAAVWDSALASAVHRITGLPVAGWGLVWGLIASALPLLALRRLAEGKTAPAPISAVRLAAGAGLVTVFVMLAASAAERAFCSGCFVTYLLVAGYAGVALFGWQRAGLPELRRAALLNSALVVGGWLALLYPGLKTPRAAGERAREAVAAVSAAPAPKQAAGPQDHERQLQEFVSSLAPELKQLLSDSLYVSRSGPVHTLPPARALIGPADAPVRITEFTDVLCGHCADLHETLQALRIHLPPGSFSIESRQFPLDGECNPLIKRKADPVRCVGAKINICLEGHDGRFEAAGALFASQKSLTPEKALDIASRFMPRSALQACIQSGATRQRLAEDIELAARYKPEGTPLVLINGRKGTSAGVFLYAMVLTGGRPDRPAFSLLPPPNPDAHLH